jgi:dolichyl-phosphate-mannose--protein O-mannosyl transferase
MFYCVFGLYVSLLWFRRLNDATPMSPTTRWLWCVAVGLALGASVSVKWTGLATPGMVGVECITGLWFLKRRARVADLAAIAAVAMVLYHICFYLHFWALPRYGADGAAHSTSEFRRTLIGGPDYDASAPVPAFLPTMWRLNKDMLLGSASINTPHQWESKYYQWVLNLKGLLFYGEPFGPQPGLWSAMYLIGNPLIVWGAAGAVVLFLLLVLPWLALKGSVEFFKARHECFRNCRLVTQCGQRTGRSACLNLGQHECVMWSLTSAALCSSSWCSFLFLGWLFNLLPYIAVTRQAFVYHYLPGLFFAQLLTTQLLEGLVPLRVRVHVYRLLGVVVSAVFVFYMPWIYSLPLTPEGHEMRRWLKTWN